MEELADEQSRMNELVPADGEMEPSRWRPKLHAVSRATAYARQRESIPPPGPHRDSAVELPTLGARVLTWMNVSVSSYSQRMSSTCSANTAIGPLGVNVPSQCMSVSFA